MSRGYVVFVNRNFNILILCFANFIGTVWTYRRVTKHRAIAFVFTAKLQISAARQFGLVVHVVQASRKLIFQYALVPAKVILIFVLKSQF